MPSTAFVIDIKNMAVDALDRGDEAEAERIVREWLSVEITAEEAQRWLRAQLAARAEGKRPSISH